jgi:hypothetical protein
MNVVSEVDVTVDVKELKSLVRRAKKGKLSKEESKKLRARLATCRETRLEEFRNAPPEAEPPLEVMLFIAMPSEIDPSKPRLEWALNTLEDTAAEGDLDAFRMLSEDAPWSENAKRNRPRIGRQSFQSSK